MLVSGVRSSVVSCYSHGLRVRRIQRLACITDHFGRPGSVHVFARIHAPSAHYSSADAERLHSNESPDFSSAHHAHFKLERSLELFPRAIGVPRHGVGIGCWVLLLQSGSDNCTDRLRISILVPDNKGAQISNFLTNC